MREEYGVSVAICFDSQAALKSLSSAKVTSALVAQTIEELQLLCGSLGAAVSRVTKGHTR